jgi:resuscitation-promoting factor RpfB
MIIAAGCSTPEPERTVDAAATTQAAPASPSARAFASAPGARPAAPKIEKRTVTEKKSVPFPTKRVSDPNLAKGTTKVTTRGVAGVRTLTYEVTFTNGVQTARKLVRQVVTKKPVTQVVHVGTKATQRCDPNYSGACVPIASDVDCAGGSGNGPAYVEGPVTIIGEDIYDLDGNDHDGIGCEN